MNSDISFPLVLMILMIVTSGAVSFFDIRSRRIPDAIVLPAIVAAITLVALSWSIPILFRYIETIVWILSLVMVRRGVRGKLGWGDVKLIALITLCVGSIGSLISLGIATAAGILSYAYLFLCKPEIGRDHLRERSIPFAPYLAAGSIVFVILDLLLGFETLDAIWR